MKGYILSIFALTSIFILSGCESILEVDPISEITNNNYWKSGSDVKGYLIEAYSFNRTLTNKALYGGDRGDAVVSGVIGGVSRAYQHEPNEEYGYDWVDFYKMLHHRNMLIKHTPKISFGQPKNRDRVLAQAYTLRVKTHLTLIESWGDVSLVFEPTEACSKDARPACSSQQEVMNQILEDTNEAIELYPESSIPDKNKMSKSAALCVEAEALTWKYTVQKSNDRQNLIDAIAAIEEVENSGVSLMDNCADIFDMNHEKNSEIIFPIYLKLDEYNDMYMSRLSMSAAVGILSADVVSKEDVPYTNSTITHHVYAFSPRLRSLSDVKDKRAASAYIDAVTKDEQVKFVSQNKYRGAVYSDDRHFDNDIVVYRLGGVLLLKAELLCYLGGENVQKAIDILNMTHNRAGVSNYMGAIDQLSARKEALNERGRELCFELKGWPDLMRVHAAGTIDIYNYVPNLVGKSTPLYFPILRKMIGQNPNPTQTQGY